MHTIANQPSTTAFTAFPDVVEDAARRVDEMDAAHGIDSATGQPKAPWTPEQVELHHLLEEIGHPGLTAALADLARHSTGTAARSNARPASRAHHAA